MRKNLPAVLVLLLILTLGTIAFGCSKSSTVTDNDNSYANDDSGVAADETTEGIDVKDIAGETNNPRVVMETTQGKIVIELYPHDAPGTVENFETLINKQFYDGLTFHRYVPNFVIQGGDPKGDGTGGPGYMIKAEFNDHPHVDGAVAMARSADPDSAGSQFYIVLNEASCRSLDGQYTVFGQVVEGMDSVKLLRQGDKMTKVYMQEKEEPKQE